MQRRLASLFALATLVGCVSAPPSKLSNKGQTVQLVTALPTDTAYESLGPVEAASTSIFSTSASSTEALRTALRNRAADLGADVVVIKEGNDGLISSLGTLRGIAYRRKDGRTMVIPLPVIPEETPKAPQQRDPERTLTERQPPQQQPQQPPPSTPDKPRPTPARIPPGKLAVLDFKNHIAEWAPEQVRYFSDLVRSAAVRIGPQLEVMTRENLAVLLQATGKELAQCEGQCEVETGRMIGADTIVSGDLQKIGKKLKLSLRLHETRGGRLLAAEVASGRDVDELDQATQDVARLLLAGAQ